MNKIWLKIFWMVIIAVLITRGTASAKRIVFMGPEIRADRVIAATIMLRESERKNLLEGTEEILKAQALMEDVWGADELKERINKRTRLLRSLYIKKLSYVRRFFYKLNLCNYALLDTTTELKKYTALLEKSKCEKVNNELDAMAACMEQKLKDWNVQRPKRYHTVVFYNKEELP